MTDLQHLHRPHLLLALSSHGYGHLSQAAPVVNALRTLIPTLRITVRGNFPEDQIKRRIVAPDTIVQVADDFGMIMYHALSVDIGASLTAYETFHESWQEKVDQLAKSLIAQKVDLVLADIPYLPLAAAQQAGIPSVALCSLNWADVLEYVLQEVPKRIPHHNHTTPISHASSIIEHIRAIYQASTHFILPTPSMSMPLLTNTIAVGPVCSPGLDRKMALRARTVTPHDTWLVLVGMGGMPFELTLDRWPSHILGKPVHYIVADHIAQALHARSLSSDTVGNTLRHAVSGSPTSTSTSTPTSIPTSASPPHHPNVIAESATGLNYSDLVASVDLIITKPGYGMFVEAAAAGVPVLYVERPHWPEAQALTDWLSSVAHCAQIRTADLADGTFTEAFTTLLEQGHYTPSPPTGNLEAARLLAQYLRSTTPVFSRIKS